MGGVHDRKEIEAENADHSAAEVTTPVQHQGAVMKKPNQINYGNNSHLQYSKNNSQYNSLFQLKGDKSKI